MAKTSKRRSEANRLQKKWLNLIKNISPERDVQCITFGKVYSKDPMDCGKPQCPLCSFDKVFHPKEHRILSRKEERFALNEILTRDEIETT